MKRNLSREWVRKQFEMLLPLAVRWAALHERRILRDGVELTAEELNNAVLLGVSERNRVRLLRVRRVPWPGASVLRAASKAVGFQVGATCGLTLGYGIYIREDCWRQPPLIAHELVHVAQYERLGGIEPFLRQYLGECLTAGYNDSALENEARTAVAKVYPERVGG